MTAIADVFVRVRADTDGLGGEIEQGAAKQMDKAGKGASSRFSRAFKNPAVLQALGVAAGQIVGTGVGMGIGAVLDGTASDSLGRLSTSLNSVSGGLGQFGIAAGALTTAAVAADALAGASDLLSISQGAATAVKGFFIATTNAETGAVTASGLSHLRAAAALAVHKAATIASTAATKAFAVAQGILNVVMSANPIVLAVIALAALTAGFVIAYKKSETFRNIVDSVFGVLKKLAALTPLGYLIKNFDKVKDAVQKVLDKIKDLIGKLKDIKFPDITPGFDIPGIPGFAKGGTLGKGLSVVGEKGPEFVYSRRGGEQVFSNAQSRRMAGSAGNSQTITVNVRQAQNEDAATAVPRALRNLGYTMGWA